jgi:hypothetical protein
MRAERAGQRVAVAAPEFVPAVAPDATPAAARSKPWLAPHPEGAL